MASIKTPSGLVIEDLVVGTGSAAGKGQQVSVHYTGWLMNGTKFDSSKDRGRAFQFSLGKGEVIRGWDEGVSGMQVGGKILHRTPAQHDLLGAEFDLRRNRNLRDRCVKRAQARQQSDRIGGVIVLGDKPVGIELPRRQHGMKQRRRA